MGCDKCAITVHGVPQARHAYDLLDRIVGKAFVSVRRDQHGVAAVKGLPAINDRYESAGPIGGVLSAMDAYPNVAWLVLACDLPFANARGIRTLLMGRDSRRQGTAFMASDGYFEPLFAIYEPSLHAPLLERFAAGHASLREALADADVRLLCPPEDRMLFNVNTPDDLAAAERLIRESGTVR
jgi:molybdopterin-guanine dinucleotide biosynthesis protein A